MMDKMGIIQFAQHLLENFTDTISQSEEIKMNKKT